MAAWPGCADSRLSGADSPVRKSGGDVLELRIEDAPNEWVAEREYRLNILVVNTTGTPQWVCKLNRVQRVYIVELDRKEYVGYSEVGNHRRFTFADGRTVECGPRESDFVLLEAGEGFRVARTIRFPKVYSGKKIVLTFNYESSDHGVAIGKNAWVGRASASVEIRLRAPATK